MLLLDITIVNVALPDIERGFDASLSDLQWVIDAYALTGGALRCGFGRDHAIKRLYAFSGVDVHAVDVAWTLQQRAATSTDKVTVR
jgi:hypothetical protein